MSKKDELNWHDARKCWRKNISINGKKKNFYFDAGRGKSDRAAYKIAQIDLKKIREELAVNDAKESKHETRASFALKMSIKKRRKLIEHANANDDPILAAEWQTEITTLSKLFKDKDFLQKQKFDIITSMRTKSGLDSDPCKKYKTRQDKSLCRAKILSVNYHEKVTSNTKDRNTVKENAEFFNDVRLDDVPDDLSAGRWNMSRTSLKELVDFVGDDFEINNFNAKTLMAYRTHLLKRSKAGDYRRKTANDKLKDTRQFLRWCWRVESMDSLPRNIDDPALSISFDIVETKAFSKNEILALMNGADEKLELYMLLAFNCGMLQQDISSLKKSEVNWQTQSITRRRSKTSKKGGNNIPVVEWQLWDRTFELLKKHQATVGDRVLLNSNGNILKRSEISPDKRICNTCNISSAYKRLMAKCKISKDKRLPFKTFRSTGATTIENSEYSKFSNHYLGDAPQSILAKHYIAKIDDRQAEFNKAIVYLGKKFNIT